MYGLSNKQEDSGVTAPEFLPEYEKCAVLPLVLNMECTATQNEMNDNVGITLNRGYTGLMSVLDSQDRAVPLSLCGAGPSLAGTLDKIKGDVLAVNSAIGVLMKAGIAPKWAMIWDCAQICEQFAIPHPETTYLIASRCHPDVFARLKDCKVIVWHADGDMNIRELLESKSVHEPLVKGGTTGITRGLYVAYALGYRDFHVFGADSCYVNGESHAAGSLVYEHLLKVMVNGRWFDSTAQWAAQIEELKMIYPMFKMTALAADITAYDDGMFAWVLSIMKKDDAKAMANAIAQIELGERQKGIAAPGSPGVLSEGAIAQLAEKYPEQMAPVMKTLQPLEGNTNV